MTIPANKAVLDPELKSALDALRAGIAAAAPQTKLASLQAQVDAIDVKLATKIFGDSNGSFGGTPLIESLKADEGVARLLKDKRGSAVFTLDAKQAHQVLQRKTTLLESAQGFQTTGVLQLDRIPGIVPEARQQLTVRDLFQARPTTLGAIDYVKVTTPMSIASPVAEGSTKPENQVSFTAYSERIKTIATWIPASRQILDDFAELSGFLSSSLAFYVRMEEELQMISGDGTSENLHGLTSQATSFNGGLLPSAAKGWTKIDVVATAIKQVTIAKELAPTFVLLNASDWWDIRLVKSTQGVYLIGDPQSTAAPSLFGLTVVPTVNIAAGTFLVGSGDPAAVEIRDKMGVTIELSTSHASFFTQNLVAVRAEERTAIVVKRGASLVYGSFTTSP
jgi:HK97 family phage major capsid protein